jgi:hypothetical protein
MSADFYYLAYYTATWFIAKCQRVADGGASLITLRARSVMDVATSPDDTSLFQD